jgi:hypothetical protein
MSSGAGSIEYPQRGKGVERPFDQERDMPEPLRGGTFGKRAKTAAERYWRRVREFWEKAKQRRTGAV